MQSFYFASSTLCISSIFHLFDKKVLLYLMFYFACNVSKNCTQKEIINTQNILTFDLKVSSNCPNIATEIVQITNNLKIWFIVLNFNMYLQFNLNKNNKNILYLFHFFLEYKDVTQLKINNTYYYIFLNNQILGFHSSSISISRSWSLLYKM